MTWEEVLIWGRNTLCKNHVPDSEIDSRYLLEHVLNVSRGEFLLHSNDAMKKEDLLKYQKLVGQRKKRIPLQYIIGDTEFMGFHFFVSEAVLVPRQETECLVELIVPFAKNKRVLDLCTGSGCIGISIAALAEGSNVVCSDISEMALETAQRNAERNNVDVSFVCSDLFKNINGRYDIIVSNPPYIKTADIGSLMPEVKDYEPRLALDGKEDGLYFYKEIITAAAPFLNPGGIIGFEIGCDQAMAVSDCMKMNRLVNVEVVKDLSGFDRIVVGRI